MIEFIVIVYLFFMVFGTLATVATVGKKREDSNSPGVAVTVVLINLFAFYAILTMLVERW